MLKKIIKIALCSIFLLSGCSHQGNTNTTISSTTSTTTTTAVTTQVSTTLPEVIVPEVVDEFQEYLDTLPILSEKSVTYEKSNTIDWSISQQNEEPGNIACENDDYIFLLGDAGIQIIQIDKKTLEATEIKLDVIKTVCISATNDSLFSIVLVPSSSKQYIIKILRYDLKTKESYLYDDYIYYLKTHTYNGKVSVSANWMSEYDETTNSFTNQCLGSSYNHLTQTSDGYYYYGDDYILKFCSINENHKKEDYIVNQKIDTNVMKVYNNQLYIIENLYEIDKNTNNLEYYQFLSKIDENGKRERLFSLDKLRSNSAMIVYNNKIYFSAKYDNSDLYILCYELIEKVLYKIDKLPINEQISGSSFFAFYFNNSIYFGSKFHSVHFEDLENLNLNDYFHAYSLDGEKIVFPSN